MSHQSIYKYGAIALLIINLGLLSFIYVGHRPPHHENAKPLNAQELLKLTEAQHDQFLELAKFHHDRIDSIKSAQRQLLKVQINSSLSGQVDDNELIQISQLEIMKVKEVRKHFNDIKNLLTLEQEADFQAFKEVVVKSITNSDKKMPEHRRIH